MNESVPAHQWWRNATLLVAVITAFVFFMGYIEETTYYARLGVPDSGLDFPASHFMAHSFSLLAMPVILLAGLVIFDYTVAIQIRRRHASGDYEEPLELFTLVPPIGMAAAVSVYWLGFQFANLGDSDKLGVLRNDSHIFGLSIIDLIINAIFLAFGLALLWAQANRKWRGIYAYMFGRTKSAQVWLAVIAIGCMLSAAQVAGNDRGNDAAWAAWQCASVPVVTFSPSASSMEDGHAYWLVLYRDGQYYLRDLAAMPDSKNLTLVRADTVDTVGLRWTMATKC